MSAGRAVSRDEVLRRDRVDVPRDSIAWHCAVQLFARYGHMGRIAESWTIPAQLRLEAEAARKLYASGGYRPRITFVDVDEKERAA